MAPATRQLPPGLREEVRQESVAGPKEDGLSLPCVWGGWGWGGGRQGLHPANSGRPRAAEQRASSLTAMPPPQAEHLPYCTENKLGVLTVPRPLGLSCLLPLDSCVPTDSDICSEVQPPS